MRSDTELAARVIAMARTGIVVDSIDLAAGIIRFSMPERDDCFVVGSGESYEKAFSSRAKQILFAMPGITLTKVMYRVRRGDVWTKVREKKAALRANTGLHVPGTWYNMVYLEYARALSSGAGNGYGPAGGCSGYQRWGHANNPTIIDVKNYSEDGQ